MKPDEKEKTMKKDERIEKQHWTMMKKREKTMKHFEK